MHLSGLTRAGGIEIGKNLKTNAPMLKAVQGTSYYKSG
jgi:hypothetical protein